MHGCSQGPRADSVGAGHNNRENFEGKINITPHPPPTKDPQMSNKQNLSFYRYRFQQHSWDIVVLKNKCTGRMDSVIGANLLPDSCMCDPCGTKACDIQAELNLSPHLPNTRK